MAKQLLHPSVIGDPLSRVRARTDDASLRVAVMLATAARLPLLVPLLWGISNSRPIALLALVAFVALDIADGVFARTLGLDTPGRRLADAVVDKLVVNVACLGMVLHDPALAAAYVPLAFRDAALIAGSLWCVVQHRTLIGSRPRHRIGAVSMALLGGTVLAGGGEFVALAAAVAWVAGYAPVPEYVRTFKAVCSGAGSAKLTTRTTEELLGADTPGRCRSMNDI